MNTPLLIEDRGKMELWFSIRLDSFFSSFKQLVLLLEVSLIQSLNGCFDLEAMEPSRKWCGYRAGSELDTVQFLFRHRESMWSSTPTVTNFESPLKKYSSACRGESAVFAWQDADVKQSRWHPVDPSSSLSQLPSSKHRVSYVRKLPLLCIANLQEDIIDSSYDETRITGWDNSQVAIIVQRTYIPASQFALVRRSRKKKKKKKTNCKIKLWIN